VHGHSWISKTVALKQKGGGNEIIQNVNERRVIG
jgi:hypothetical protein